MHFTNRIFLAEEERNTTVQDHINCVRKMCRFKNV